MIGFPRIVAPPPQFGGRRANLKTASITLLPIGRVAFDKVTVHGPVTILPLTILPVTILFNRNRWHVGEAEEVDLLQGFKSAVK